MPASFAVALPRASRGFDIGQTRHVALASSSLFTCAAQGGLGRGARADRRRHLYQSCSSAETKPSFVLPPRRTYTTTGVTMASKTTSILLRREPPLSFMEHLSSSVSYYCPKDAIPLSNKSDNDNAPADQRRHPELILVLSWMGARDVHIEKYIAQHRVLFPSSRILLIRSPASHVFWPSLARRHIPPAIRILRQFAEPETRATNNSRNSRPRVLLHILSNGGVSTAARIRELLRRELGSDSAGNKLVIPRYALCLDSCPGNFVWKSTHQALLQSLPRWTSPLVHFVIAVAWLIYKLRLTRPAQNLNAEALRRGSLLPRETQRTYLYGTADAIIDWRQVEDHARRAEESGFKVRKEKFEGGEHVSLVRKESQRYWQAVKETWHEAELDAEKTTSQV
ncbi:hypothetical protein LI328DRAFT_74834 [Trichoderma asperelloides]|nr:hypothetical protein LI328DRAFT_74834 [Trichoderma asperelloides]